MNDSTFDEIVAQLPARVRNVLQNEGIHTLPALLALTRVDFLRTPNVGRVSVDMLEAVLALRGLRLGRWDEPTLEDARQQYSEALAKLDPTALKTELAAFWRLVHD